MGPKSLVWGLFGAIGVLLLVALVVWVANTLITKPFSPTIPEPTGPKAMGTDPNLPNEEWADAESKAKATMEHLYRSSHAFGWWSQCADWVSFLLTAAITLIVGATGQLLQGAGPAAPLPAGAVPSAAASLGRKWVRRIGVMAALASVMTAVSGRIGTSSQERLTRADKLREVITKAQTDYAVVPNRTQGLAIVNNLNADRVKFE
jgi:hypothetical protein